MAAIDGVRAFIQENIPEDWALEERRMFGMVMWLVRGNMFIGVGQRTERLLVRVGDDAVEATLATQSQGVERCATEGGRTFRGTLMVGLEQFRGEQRLRPWFEMAMAHNASLEAKQPEDKPRKRATTQPGPPRKQTPGAKRARTSGGETAGPSQRRVAYEQ
jgi:hypothetical protein